MRRHMVVADRKMAVVGRVVAVLHIGAAGHMEPGDHIEVVGRMAEVKECAGEDTGVVEEDCQNSLVEEDIGCCSWTEEGIALDYHHRSSRY